MLCGAIILSLFTANVTSVLTSNQMDDTKNLIGRRVSRYAHINTDLSVGIYCVCICVFVGVCVCVCVCMYV